MAKKQAPKEVKKAERLTPKQEAFVREYIIDLNATQAAIRAGYSEKTARQIGEENLTKPVIKKMVEELKAQRAERLNITADYVLEIIVETVDRCRQEIRPLLDKKGRQVKIEDKEGKECKAFVFDAKNVLKGCELLGRHIDLFKDGERDDGPAVIVIENGHSLRDI